jgi:hypothetical protein
MLTERVESLPVVGHIRSPLWAIAATLPTLFLATFRTRRGLYRGRDLPRRGLLDHGVAAVLGLNLEDVTGPVSDHGVVVPVGEQRRL